jgi:hypothetical protein
MDRIVVTSRSFLCPKAEKQTPQTSESDVIDAASPVRIRKQNHISNYFKAIKYASNNIIMLFKVDNVHMRLFKYRINLS